MAKAESLTDNYYLQKELFLEGEEWRDIPGFEAYYQVSSFGRIRSLDRFVNHKSGKPILVKGRILSQSKRLDKNLLTGEPSVALRVTLMMENISYNCTVRRLVYLTFIGKLEKSLVVINIDGNGYNNCPDNLKAVSHSEKGKRVMERKRAIPSLLYLDRSKFMKTGGGYSRQRAIQQKDMSGNLIASFVSVVQASRATGIGEKEIIMVAKGRWKQFKGYVFEYTDNDD